MKPATINFPDNLVQGDTLEEFSITFKVEGEPMDIASSRVSLNTRNGLIVYEWDVTVDGGTITCATVEADETKTWPVGELVYGVELTLADGKVISPIRGVLVVLSNTVV
jgi:hypothetical protein